MEYQRYKYQPGIPPALLGGADTAKMLPEIYFKLEPEISMCCDELEAKVQRLSLDSLTEEMVESTTDRIHGNVTKKYPDLAEYAQEYEKSFPTAGQSFEVYGMQIRRRGLFRDLIAFLLLAELFRRSRRRRRRRFR